MKVTLIGPVYPYRGGISHHTTLLAQELQKKHSVQLISYIRQYPKWLYPGTSDRDPSQQPVQIEASYLLDPLNPISWLKTYWKINKFQPNFVIIPWWTTFWAPADFFLSFLLRRKKIPVLYLIHNVLPHETRKLDPLLARIGLKSGSGFLVQSEQEQARLQGLIGKANMEYYPHPVYRPFAEQPITRTEARQRLEIPADRTVLLFFGIVRPYKGLRILLEAMNQPELKETHPILLVAGEIWGDPQEYFGMVERLGLKDQVHFYNRYIKNEELPIFFHAADLFVAPYLEGTQSGAVKMALGYGMPVVATDFVIDQELRSKNQPRILCVPAGSPSALAEGILSIRNATPPDGFLPPDQGEEPGWDGLAEAIEKLANSNHRAKS